MFIVTICNIIPSRSGAYFVLSGFGLPMLSTAVSATSLLYIRAKPAETSFYVGALLLFIALVLAGLGNSLPSLSAFPLAWISVPFFMVGCGFMLWNKPLSVLWLQGVSRPRSVADPAESEALLDDQDGGSGSSRRLDHRRE